jgi:hypothetical protein
MGSDYYTVKSTYTTSLRSGMVIGGHKWIVCWYANAIGLFSNTKQLILSTKTPVGSYLIFANLPIQTCSVGLLGIPKIELTKFPYLASLIFVNDIFFSHIW